MLEFRLLGDVAVLADGQPLSLGGTRERSVLALLVLQRSRPIATELLADRLWPDDLPLTAIKTVQVYVSRLRHALGPYADRLSSSPTGYKLAVDDDELDVARFERGLREAREALASGFRDAAVSGFEEILALWSGPALGDLAAERFARREADRLEELRFQALEELFELQIGAGSGRDTIAELRRLTGEQPGRERLWRLPVAAIAPDLARMVRGVRLVLGNSQRRWPWQHPGSRRANNGPWSGGFIGAPLAVTPGSRAPPR
jgi:DNA-binding SARP family transcriptional activator